MNKKVKILLIAAIVALLGFSAYYFKDSALFKGILRSTEPLTAEEIADAAMTPLASVVKPIKAEYDDCPKDELCTWPLTPGKESAFKVLGGVNFAAPDIAGEWRSIEAGYDDLDITYNTEGTSIKKVQFKDRSTVTGTTTLASYTINWGDGSELESRAIAADPSPVPFRHNFDTVEKTTVVYTVIDADGRSDSVTFEVTPPPAAPALTGCTAEATSATDINWTLTHSITDEGRDDYRTTYNIDELEPFLEGRTLEENENMYGYTLESPLAIGTHTFNATIFRIGADGERTSDPALTTSCDFTVEAATPPADPADIIASCTATVSTTEVSVNLNHDITGDFDGYLMNSLVFVPESTPPAALNDNPADLKTTGSTYNFTYVITPSTAPSRVRVNILKEIPESDDRERVGQAECTIVPAPSASTNVVLAATKPTLPSYGGGLPRDISPSDLSRDILPSDISRIDPADLRRMAMPTPDTSLPLQMDAKAGATVYFKAADTSDAMMVEITPRDTEIRPALLRIGAESVPKPDRPDSEPKPLRPDSTAINAVCDANPTTALVGETITFTGAGSTGAYTSAALNFGDEDPTIRLGATEVSRVTGNTTHIYDTAGTYTFTIKLWGADDTGGDSCEKTVTITAPVTITQKECADGRDNDSDGYIDLVDSGCVNSVDDDERTQTTTLKKCADGRDNDGDGEVDLRDEGCDNATDDDEVDVKDPVKPKTSTDDEISFDSCIKKNKKAKQFADVDDDDHGADVIALLSRAKYIGEYDPALDDYILKGYEEDGERQFKPEKTVSRAEWTKMIELGLCGIDKALDDGDLDEDPVGYADTKDHWAEPYVNIAGNLGIVDINKRKFNPNSPITVAEGVKMILESHIFLENDNIELLEFDEDDNPFDDVDEDDWFADYAYTAYKWDIVEGNKTTSGKLNFNGNRYLSRLGAAILLYNYLVVADDIQEEDAPEPIKIKRITN